MHEKLFGSTFNYNGTKETSTGPISTVVEMAREELGSGGSQKQSLGIAWGPFETKEEQKFPEAVGFHFRRDRVPADPLCRSEESKIRRN
jgi:hypothetical protein